MDVNKLQREIRRREDAKREALEGFLESLEAYANAETHDDLVDALFFARILGELWIEEDA